MDPVERIGRHSDYVATRELIRSEQADIFTALPATVVKFTPAEMTVSAQATVQYQQRKPDGTWNYLTLPVCIHCPVLFPRGGPFRITFPLAEGDEGLLIFASRCIDNWWLSGGVQKQAELRMHDISDGFFLPGCFSQPNVPANVSTTDLQIRSLDGTIGLDVSATTGFKFTGPVEFVGPVQFDAGITGNAAGGVISGAAKFAGDVVAKAGTGGSVTLSTHTHTQPNDSHGDVEGPTSSPTGGT